MGWRDINMNRRTPQPRYAMLPIGPGEDRASAVLRKSAMDAVAGLMRQDAEFAGSTGRSFAAGYVLGYARQVALQHGIDCEANMMAALAAAVARLLPAALDIDLSAMEFAVRDGSDARSRTSLRCIGPGSLADAGYLVGHLEALCGTRTLLQRAMVRLRQGDGHSASAYLTDCDIAADPMQTRQPTARLRFDAAERAVLTAAFAETMA